MLVKLFNKGVPVVLIRLLRNWYGRLSSSVLWNNALGDVFSVNCSVRQGGILSPILFIGKLFAGCILYADDILLLSSSCHGLQSMLHICNEFGKRWDIHFNPAKTQCVTFGRQAPRQCNLAVGGKSLTCSSKLKYLVCSKSGSCEFDILSAIGKFYSQFNNIMAVLGKQKNEMAAVHI